MICLGMLFSLSGCSVIPQQEEPLLPEPETQIEREAQLETELQTELQSEVEQKIEQETQVQTETEQQEESLTAYYAYRSLNQDEKKLYRQLLYAMTKMQAEIDTSTLDTDMLDKVFNCVMNDHPELFFVSGYQYTRYTRGDVLTKLTFCAQYTMSKEQVTECQFAIEDYVATCFAGMPNSTDEYEKVKYCYEYIILHTEYDLQAENNQNICSVFLTGRSVCQGYAKAVQYLLQKAGIESFLVTGYANQGTHAWNLVKVDGAYYYLDATWGDASYSFAGESGEYVGEVPPINYDYFLVTTEDLQVTHSIGNVIDLPQCTEKKDNYYIREGLYLTAWDTDKIKHIFEMAYLEKNNYVTIKCENEIVYQEIKEKLIDEQQVFQYIKQRWESIAYVENSRQLTISFWL